MDSKSTQIPKKHGSVDYLNRNIIFIRLPGNSDIQARIVVRDRSLAELSFVDSDGKQVPVPPGHRLVFAVDKSPVCRRGDTFAICWVEDYQLMRGTGADQCEVFRLAMQKQQFIQGDNIEIRTVGDE